MAHYAQQEYEYFPWLGNLGRRTPSRIESRRMMPLPPKLVPIFLDGPNFEVAIQRFNQWATAAPPLRVEHCVRLTNLQAGGKGFPPKGTP
jgi:hypothetical protein